MGCKDDKLITELVTATGFNRNIMGCKVEYSNTDDNILTDLIGT